MFAYVSTRYQTEAGTRLHLAQVLMYDTPATPWTARTAVDLLDQLQEH